jgi:hypothetical protein
MRSTAPHATLPRKRGRVAWGEALPQGGRRALLPDAQPCPLILVPATADGLALALGETHRRYAGFVNARMRAAGFLDRLEARQGRTLRPGEFCDTIPQKQTSSGASKTVFASPFMSPRLSLTLANLGSARESIFCRVN